MTTTDARYRIVGDIAIKGKAAANGIIKGKKVEISYGSKKTANFDNISIVQLLQPLTPESPYFLVEVHRCGMYDVIFVFVLFFKVHRFRSKCNRSNWCCTLRY